LRFAMIKNTPGGKYYNNSQKVVLGNFYRQGKVEYVISLAFIEAVKNDFDLNDDYILTRSYCSVQYRPNTIYFDNNGFYHKVNGKKVYFSEKEQKEIQKKKTEFTNYLLSKYNFRLIAGE